jgi:hypothetical protein
MNTEPPLDGLQRIRKTRSFARRVSGYLLLALGLSILLQLGSSAREDVRVFTQYRPATCTIIGKRLAVSRAAGGSSGATSTYYAPEFTLRFDVERSQRIATGYDNSGAATGSAAHNQEILARYNVWQDYPCWYDPASASRVVLIRSIPLYYLFAIVSLLAIPAGMALLRGGVPGETMPPENGQPVRTAPEGGHHSSASLFRWILGIGVAFALVAAFFFFVITVLIPAYRPAPPGDAARLEMFEYFETGQLGSVRASIEYGVSPDARDARGVPLLIRTLERCGVTLRDGDYGEFAAYLLQKRASVNAYSEQDGETPLFAAIHACPAPLVRTLIGAGARLDDRNSRGESALAAAMSLGRMDVVEVLRSSGARD